MTDAESLMWNVEQDPRLRSTMGAIVLVDGPIDMARLRNTIVRALPHVPALRERVQPSGVPLVPPEWVLDRHLDLDHHLRASRMAGSASLQALEALACRVINDPFDRTRPLWQIDVVSGLPRGRSALVVKLHHSIADGQGALALAAHLLEFQADAPPPDDGDVEETIAALADESPRDPEPASLGDSLRFGAERIAGFLNEAANALANPQRAAEAGATVKHLADQLPTADSGVRSPLWARRSGNRRLSTLAFPLASLTRAAGEREMKVNELFVTACAEATLTQHERAAVALPEIHTSVVISTRTPEDPAAQNAVIPVALTLPGTGFSREDRLDSLRSQVEAKRASATTTSDAVGALGAVANLLPAAVAASLALQQTGRIDIATSNLAGPAIPLWIAGRRVVSLRPVGPVAGTACNATLLSVGDEAALGLHVDPATGIDPDTVRGDLRSTLMSLGVVGVPR